MVQSVAFEPVSDVFLSTQAKGINMKKAILGIALISLIAPASLQAQESSCGWIHYAAAGFAVGGAAASSGGGFLISTAVSSVTSGFMFCDWWGAITALEREQAQFIVYNHSSLLEEAPRGSGPHVEALASLQGCPMDAQMEFGSMFQQTYAENSEFFLEYNQSPEHTREFMGLIREWVQQDPVLSKECQTTG
tara:strand:- start:136 stop:711 length:576 start_codon:yes stop_codon:yes gene_type:complete